MPRPQVVYSLGRADRVNERALRRLAKSIRPIASPQDLLHVHQESPLRIGATRSLGGVWVLDHMWQRLGMGSLLGRLLSRRRYQAPVERAIFAMVANRALAPRSKLALQDWVQREVYIPGLPRVAVQHLYRAMDFLLVNEEDLQREVFYSVSDHPDLEIDLLYFDVTPASRGGQRKKEGSSGRAPARGSVVGVAVTSTGLPVRCWTWPDSTPDVTVAQDAVTSLVGWRPRRVLTVVDRDVVSEEVIAELERTGRYVVGERASSATALSRKTVKGEGRGEQVRSNLHVREILVGDSKRRVRYVLVHDPDEAECQKADRELALRRLEEELELARLLTGAEREKAVARLRADATYRPYLSVTEGGLPTIDREKVLEEARYDGEYLLKASDASLTAEEAALGYRQLVEIENTFRMLQAGLDTEPMKHHLSERIRAHVLLCWLALLLVRVVELGTHEQWAVTRESLQRIQALEYGTDDGRVCQRTELTEEQQSILQALGVKEPPLLLDVQLELCPW